MKTSRSFRLFPRCFPPFCAFLPGAVCLHWLYFHKTDSLPFQGSRGTDGTLPVPSGQIQRRTRPDIPVVFEADAAHWVDRAVCRERSAQQSETESRDCLLSPASYELDNE